jgi:iron complex outermembrane receptor protein
VVNGVNTPVTRDLTYRNTLPNVQASYDLTPRLRLRAAFTKTLARPDFNQFAMGQTETRDANGFPVITGTNPDLPPRLASGYDLSAEYNFKDGYASVGLFHKDLANESFNQTTRDTNPAGNVIFTRTIPLGSGSGTLRGFEASWVKRRFSELPAPLNRFGLEANFTRLDGEWNVVFANGTRRTVDGLRNQPRWLGSIIPSYTIGRFELRAPWRLRGKTFTGTFGTTAAGDVYVEDLRPPRFAGDLQTEPGMEALRRVPQCERNLLDAGNRTERLHDGGGQSGPQLLARREVSKVSAARGPEGGVTGSAVETDFRICAH